MKEGILLVTKLGENTRAIGKHLARWERMPISTMSIATSTYSYMASWGQLAGQKMRDCILLNTVQYIPSMYSYVTHIEKYSEADFLWH